MPKKSNKAKKEKYYTPIEFFEQILCKKFSKKELEWGLQQVEKLEKSLRKLGLLNKNK